jgi:hypothetical protein
MERPDQDVKGIILKEYGRNIQKIVSYIKEIPDREKRSRYAKTLIELMKQINPAMRDAQDSHHKLWDHLYIMSNFDLDVDTPYPMPDKSVIGKKPMKVDYNLHQLHFKHYGRNIELLIQKAIDMPDKEEQEAAIIYIGKLMKRFYASWNKENIDDEVIVEHLTKMSKRNLMITVEKVKAGNLFDSVIKEHKDYNRQNVNQNSGNSYQNSGGGNNNNNNQNRRNNNNRRPQDNKRRNNQNNQNSGNY